jgi:hypothetical protein
MSSIKCAQCGLVNFSHAENCKRCRATLHAARVNAPPNAAAAENRGEDASPLPVVGAWRDRRWLVKQLGVPLIQRCIKCSESADVTYKPVSLKVYSAWSLLTHFIGVRVFRMIPVEIPLCRRHRSGMDWVALGLVLAGLAGCIAGFALLQMNSALPIVMFGVGFLLMAVGFLFSVGRNDVVRVWRYKDPYIWLWGVDRSFLEALPEWSKRHAR